MNEERIKELTEQFHKEVIDTCNSQILELEMQLNDIQESLNKIHDRKLKSIIALNKRCDNG